MFVLKKFMNRAVEYEASFVASHSCTATNVSAVRQLECGKQKNIFPLALVNPIGKISEEWHNVAIVD